MRAIKVHWKLSSQLIALALLKHPVVNVLSTILLAIIAVGRPMIEKVLDGIVFSMCVTTRVWAIIFIVRMEGG